MGTYKGFIKKIVPAILLDLARRCYNSVFGNRNDEIVSGEKSKEWYDGEYKKQTIYHQHYSDSPYYFLWTVIADRLVRSHKKSVIDIGCGSGQFATLLQDKKIPSYTGIDLSEEAIRLAKKNCLGYRFLCENVFESNLLTKEDYDCFVSLECLEHLENDLELLKLIKPGTFCLFTVPNFPYVSHVRYFDDEYCVSKRYSKFFLDFSVDTFLENSSGKKFFLAEGKKI